MRRFAWIAALLALAGTAAADDAHDEMAAALVAQADLHPAPLQLPTTAQAPQHAAGGAATAAKHGTGPAAAQATAHANEGRAQGQANAAAHQAQAAANAAAGQAQAEAAKQRAKSHPHPHPTH